MPSMLPKLIATLAPILFVLGLCPFAATGQETFTGMPASTTPKYIVEVRLVSYPTAMDADGSPNPIKKYIEQLDPTRIKVDGGTEVALPVFSEKNNNLLVSPGPAAQTNAVDAETFQMGSNTPSLTAILKDSEIVNLIQMAKSRSEINICQTPTITVFANQAATVSDGAERPFVTGLSALKNIGGETIGYQPSIRTFTEGMRLNVMASPDGDLIQLKAQIEASQIVGVTEMSLRNMAKKQESDSATIQIQLPEVETKTLSISNSIPNGSTLLVVSGITKQQSRQEKKVPVLGDAPLIKRFFRSQGIVDQPMWNAWLFTVKEIPQ